MTELQNKLNELVEKKESLTRELERINYQIESLETRIKVEGEKIDKCQSFLSVAAGVFNEEKKVFVEKNEDNTLKNIYFKSENFIFVYEYESDNIYRIDKEDLEVVIYRQNNIDDIIDEYKEDARDNRDNKLRRDRIDDCEYNYCNDGLEDWLDGCDIDYYKDDILEERDLMSIDEEFQDVLEEEANINFRDIVYEMDDSLSIKA